MKRKFTLRMILMMAFMVLGMGSAWAETITKTIHFWNFKTASWVKESGFGTSTITINSQSCTYATGDLDGLALQGGAGTSWTVNSSGLTQGNGERSIAILNLQAGDAVIVETASTISSLVNGTSTNDTYTGTCKFSVTSDGAFGFAMDRNKYTTSITVLREVEADVQCSWNFKTASWVKESGFGTSTITINAQSCTYATGDLAGLALQGGAGTGWTVNSNGLTQGNGNRNIAILNLRAGDAVIVETAATISALVNGMSTNDTYTGTCTFSVTSDGAFGFATDRNNYTTSITVLREVKMATRKNWNFKTATWAKESGFGTSTIIINNQSCTYAIGDLAGLALQGGAGTSWTVNGSGLTQGNGGRNIAVLDLKAGQVVTIVTATALSAIVNGTSINNSYTGTCKFLVSADGAFGFNTTRNAYITSITVSEKGEFIGSNDFSTGYLGATSDLATLSPGSTAEFHFINYNSYTGEDIQNWLNFVVPVYDASNNRVLTVRADNWEDIKSSNEGCACNYNWNTFDSELNGATVDMIVNYTTDNVFQAWTTITTSSGLTWKYYYSSDYNNSGISLSGNIKTGISVNTSYLLVKSWDYAAKVPMTLSSVGWATLYTPFALDFSGTGLTAYTATVANDQVTLAEVSSVPANTGVVLKGEAGSYEIPVVASSTETNKGDLQGAPATDRWMSDDTDYYMLAYNSEADKVQFTKLTSGSIAAGKAYLVQAKGNGARTLNVVFAEDGTTGIQTLDKTPQADGACYNLNGQRVSQPAKGLYIVNGKKVVIK